jgi:ribosomal protein L34E
MNSARLLLFALRALVTARRRVREFKMQTPELKVKLSASRRKAVEKLGGRCACCGLGMEFWPALSIHHVNHNGSEHREVRRAFGLSIEGEVLTRDEPGGGLFALTPLCLVCHTMIHAQGYCPHERMKKRAA